MKPLGPFIFRTLSNFGVVAIALSATPSAALAHGAHIQARTASAIEIQAAYDSGEPMAEAQVQVFAPDDPKTPVFSGITDTAGRFVFVPTQPGDWEISVRQAGHGDIAVIPVAGEGAIADGFVQSNSLNGLQRMIIAAAVAWGCVGTALYFSRGKR